MGNFETDFQSFRVEGWVKSGLFTEIKTVIESGKALFRDYMAPFVAATAVATFSLINYSSAIAAPVWDECAQFADNPVVTLLKKYDADADKAIAQIGKRTEADIPSSTLALANKAIEAVQARGVQLSARFARKIV